MKLTVKFGLITILRTQADLCEQLEKVDEPCTVKKGPHVIMKEIEIPKEIPPVSSINVVWHCIHMANTRQGKYSVNAAAFTKDDEKITCLDAVVHFDRS